MSIIEDNKISFVIPTINEEKTIGSVIDGIHENFPNAEIILVDTNSTDKTKEIAKSKGATVIEEPRKGYGRAYQTGIPAAKGDIIVCMDGDGTYPTDIVKPLIEILILDKVDFISCDRITFRTSTNYTTLHYVGNMVLNLTIRILFKVRMVDSQSGMWIFRSELYKKMKNLGYGMSFSQNIKIEAVRHGVFIEIPIRYGVRITKPKLKTWHDGFHNLFALFIKRVSE
ncbi:glycosyl transferase [Thermoplasma volcanium GSS1]|uniref:Glycosyl transferase n=1 Tax=Thermoplasma volcanium (strain ATCC 51530 / DSM 4299 / JCM 9571 / NBRC 15438 / GSS1) TaxID=273116 RepID=Q97C79_THEVO|nr:glycosyltransferase family 2 protein [Thermoplasma volcanium]BAB59366.1 glycosyl transferase [Thermoplasma volcanium GSS1]